MGRIKGCGNGPCEANKKKITYKETETFCSRCGRPLVYVCRECYTQLPDNTEKYCVRCHAKREDRKDKAKKAGVGIGGGALAVGGVLISFVKNVPAVIKNFRG